MSWYDLLATTALNREFARQEKDPPVACPNDGEPLGRDMQGHLRCPFDGWTWKGFGR